MVPTYSGGVNKSHISLDLGLKIKLLGPVAQTLTRTSILKWRTIATVVDFIKTINYNLEHHLPRKQSGGEVLYGLTY